MEFFVWLMKRKVFRVLHTMLSKIDELVGDPMLFGSAIHNRRVKFGSKFFMY